MSENDNSSTAGIDNEPYGDLMNAARSAREQFEAVEIDTDAPKKDELVEQMSEYDFEGDRENGWSVEVDGEREDVNLLNVQTPEKSSYQGKPQPKDKTVLYCQTRAHSTDELVGEALEAVKNNTVFEVNYNDTGNAYSIILPAEEDPEQAELFEEDDDESDEEEVEESESEPESDSEESETEESEEASEASEEPEEDADEEPEEEPETEVEEDEEDEDVEEESDDDDDDSEDEEEQTIPASAARKSFESKETDELYQMCVEYDIEDASELDDWEMVDALIEAHPKVQNDA